MMPRAVLSCGLWLYLRVAGFAGYQKDVQEDFAKHKEDEKVRWYCLCSTRSRCQFNPLLTACSFGGGGHLLCFQLFLFGVWPAFSH